MKNKQIVWAIIILVFLIVNFLFFLIHKRSESIENEKIKAELTLDTINFENTIDFTNRILKESSFLTVDRRLIPADTLISKSVEYFIFFTEQDCDYCVHQLVYLIDKYIERSNAVIVPLCANIKLLQFANRNYFTEFEFYTTCPYDDGWQKEIHTPFIAYVSSKKASVMNVLPYEANDTIQLKEFLENNIIE